MSSQDALNKDKQSMDDLSGPPVSLVALKALLDDLEMRMARRMDARFEEEREARRCSSRSHTPTPSEAVAMVKAMKGAPTLQVQPSMSMNATPFGASAHDSVRNPGAPTNSTSSVAS